jgi:hypothetical protein
MDSKQYPYKLITIQMFEILDRAKSNIEITERLNSMVIKPKNVQVTKL